MILLRQKIFFNYSGYSPEEIAKIKAERHEQAVRLMEARRQAQTRLKNSNDFSKSKMETNIQKLGDLGLGNRATGEARQSYIEQHQSNVNRNYQARNEAYDEALKNSAKFRAKLDKKYKRTMPVTNNPNNNPYNTSVLGNTYKNKNANTNTTTKTTTQPQQKQGIGLGGKLAIGAGVAATGYGAYRLIKARRQKQQNEETESTQRPQGNQQVKQGY